MKNRLNNSGFTYVMALTVVMIMGIMLGMAGMSCKTMMQREREEELLFRGQQIREAIRSWYERKRNTAAAPPLRDLKDLLHDPNSLTTVRYLRRLYTDPITGKEWNVISDPNKGISGVYSSSPDQPLKTAGFPDDLKEFAGKTHYSEWQFVYYKNAPTTGTTPAGATATPGGGGTPGMTGGATGMTGTTGGTGSISGSGSSSGSGSRRGGMEDIFRKQ